MLYKSKENSGNSRIDSLGRGRCVHAALQPESLGQGANSPHLWQQTGPLIYARKDQASGHLPNFSSAAIDRQRARMLANNRERRIHARLREGDRGLQQNE